MSFLLDTNICSEYLRRPSKLFHRFVQHSGRLHLSAIGLSEHDLTLVTHNVKDFEHVPGLRIEDWMAD